MKRNLIVFGLTLSVFLTVAILLIVWWPVTAINQIAVLHSLPNGLAGLMLNGHFIFFWIGEIIFVYWASHIYKEWKGKRQEV